MEKKQIEVFLGGTCADSTWRDRLIKQLKVDYFNPVVDDWTPEAQEIEKEKRKTCEYVLYVITPLMHGVYSIAETVDDSNKRPEKTLFCFLREDDEKEFDEAQIKSLKAVGELIQENGGKWFQSLYEIAFFLNNINKI